MYCEEVLEEAPNLSFAHITKVIRFGVVVPDVINSSLDDSVDCVNLVGGQWDVAFLSGEHVISSIHV